MKTVNSKGITPSTLPYKKKNFEVFKHLSVKLQKYKEKLKLRVATLWGCKDVI